MNKISKLVSVILVVCVIVNFIIPNNVNANSNSDVTSVFVDGIEYLYYMADNGDFILKTAENSNYYGEIILHSDGSNANAKIYNGENTDIYELSVNELSDEDVDVDVIQDGDVVENYNSIDDISSEEYECQAATTVTVTVISIATLLDVILTVAAVITIAGVTYYSLSKAYEAIKEDSKKKGYIYRATLSGKGVYIDYKNPIKSTDAVVRMRSALSIYTYNSTVAQSITFNTQLGCIEKSEIDKDMKKGYIYYYHWHTANRNGAHAWFGRPYHK